MTSAARLGILWRGNREARDAATAENNRLSPLFAALAGLNVHAEPVVYAEEQTDEVRAQLLRLDGVLVWVDPISGGRDRSGLDALLREVSSEGVWVSAHPDVILKMGTKDVLFETRELGWGSDTYLYRSMEEFQTRFPPQLASGEPRVLKQHRGNGGIGVWKVELAARPEGGAAPRAETIVRVQHARDRGTDTEDMTLGAFTERCTEYFRGDGHLIDQPFQPRVSEGMIRCYMAQDRVAGFARQFAAAPPEPEGKGDDSPPQRILGLPAAKTMYGPTEPSLHALKARMESDWVPAMQRLLEIDTSSLPAIWDADFLYGPKTEAGDDTYVLCEINVSSCYPLPAEAFGKLARAAAARVALARNQRTR